MATVSLTVSTEHESGIDITPVARDGECLSIVVLTNLAPIYHEGPPLVYSRDTVYIHGNLAAMRLLAQKIIAALPAEVAPAESAEQVAVV